MARILTRTRDIYQLLLCIAKAPQNASLKVELQKTAEGAGGAMWGAGLGGTAGALLGALLGGRNGAVAGAAAGAGLGAAVGTQGKEFKSIPEIWKNASASDKERIAQAAITAAVKLAIDLTWSLAQPVMRKQGRKLLMQVLTELELKVL